MRTTVTIPDQLFDDVKKLISPPSFSSFVKEAVEERLERLKREQLLRDMEEGYRDEASNPSLDPEWNKIEVEGL